MTSTTERDPYAYLEDSADPRTEAWTQDQNARTRAALDAVPGRERLSQRLDGLLRTDVASVPVVRGGRAFAIVRRGEALQASLCVREGSQERRVLDPIAIDATGLTTIDWWFPSPSGALVGYGLSRNGDERSTLHVVETATGVVRGEAIPDTRYSSVAWDADETAFFYTRYPAGGMYDVRVYRHVLGTPHESDVLVFGAGRKREDMLRLERSPDGRWLIVVVDDGWARSDVYVADTHAEPLRFAPIAEGRLAQFDAHPGDDAVYVRTDEGASRFRVFRVDPREPSRDAWIEIVPQTSGTLEGIVVAGDALVLHYLEDVRSVVRVRYGDGRLETLGQTRGRSVIAMTANAADVGNEAYLQLASYVEAPEIVRTRLRDDAPARLETWDRIATPFDANAYRVEQRWYLSRDGTRVPMSIVAHRDTAFDGTAPVVLYGYGGFNVSLVPAFAPHLVPWLDAGGVYAVANLRGGGEFGESWHAAGMRAKKQNVFDDFIAAAEFLASERIADPARLAVMGGSNGGLLVAAFATQRPDLARAVVCLVPLCDMLRFHEFLIARLWISEYGDPDVASEATILRAYSPYHNVRDGVAYPAMLIATAESDGRVDPMHARKFGARVQAATASDAPIYVYVEPNAGHGVGKPRHKIVAELADRWCFIATQLGVALDVAR